MSESLVGIFWIKDDGGLIVNAIEWDKSEMIIDTWVNYSNHYQFWETYSKEHNLPSDYVTYTRGRVLYNKKTKTSKLLASRDVLKNKKLITKLVKAFKLDKYVLEQDDHYEQADFLLDLMEGEEF